MNAIRCKDCDALRESDGSTGWCPLFGQYRAVDLVRRCARYVPADQVARDAFTDQVGVGQPE